MWEFLRAGGPFMFLLLFSSIVGLTFIIERGLVLRWKKVIPPLLQTSVENCKTLNDLPMLERACQQEESPFGRVILSSLSHLDVPLQENMDAVQTRARHEVTQLERGLVILEIITGIGPLLGLVGTIHGLITLFGDLGKAGLADNTQMAKGISIALNTTLMGLLVAIPSLVAWSYYSKKVEVFAVEMESLCDGFLRRIYRKKEQK